MDEAHRLKNQNSTLTEKLRLVERKHCVLLTGTPLQNKTEEVTNDPNPYPYPYPYPYSYSYPYP